MIVDKHTASLLRKYYLAYPTGDRLSASDFEKEISAGTLVPPSEITHDETVSEIKRLSERISLAATAKSFLYSLSSGDRRRRSALSSLVWAKSLPEHSSATTKRNEGSCAVCGCSHGLDHSEIVDWNEYGVFRYLPPTQYGREPNLTCAEYVLNDLREFEKLPEVEPRDEDYRILNDIFGVAKMMKPHNRDSALISEIRRRKLLDATGNEICCLLGVLGICGVLESSEDKGFLHRFTNCDEIVNYRDGLNFYPLYAWRGKDGINRDAVDEIFGGFCGDKLDPDKTVPSAHYDDKVPVRKSVSRASDYFTEGVHCVSLTNEERRYLALNDLRPEWDSKTFFSVTYKWKKRTVLFFDGDNIVKVFYEEYVVEDDGSISQRRYREYDTCLATDDRKLLLPLTSRGRAKPLTPSNVMATPPFGCELDVLLQNTNSSIWAGNPRNGQVIAIGEKERVGKIQSDADFHKFMRHYVSTCPNDYFERIAEVRGMERQTVRFRAGDIFRCQLDREHYAYGVILGKTRALEKWTELPEEHSFRNLMTQPIIVRMYDFVATSAEMTAEQLSGAPLRAPMICSDADVLWGTHKIVDHKELEPDDILFPLNLSLRTTKNSPSERKSASISLRVEWGFASFETPWEKTSDALRELLARGAYYNTCAFLRISGDDCGKTLEEILRDSPRASIQNNLLLPENRDRFKLVMNRLGLPKDCSYDDFAKKFGGITRQKYIELIKERCE